MAFCPQQLPDLIKKWYEQQKELTNSLEFKVTMHPKNKENLEKKF